jgi:hypothetical protein
MPAFSHLMAGGVGNGPPTAGSSWQSPLRFDAEAVRNVHLQLWWTSFRLRERA